MTRSPAVLLLLAMATAGSPAVQSAELDAEDIARLQGRIEAHDESIESFRRQLQRAEAEMIRLRRDLDDLNQRLSSKKDGVTPEQLKALADQVQELEKRRVKDNQEILAALDRMSRVAAVPPPSTSRPAPVDPPKPEPSGPELPAEFHEHVIESGQTLSSVITEYNRQLGYKVTLAHVLKANPEIKDPRRIRVGQKIRIPQVK